MAKVDGANLALERGWAVIAVWGVRPDGSCRCPQAGECKAAGKHPISSRWRSATLQQSNIDNMLAASGDLHNWGILTGPASGVWVLDIDAGSGGLDTLTRSLVPAMRQASVASANGWATWRSSSRSGRSANC